MVQDEARLVTERLDGLMATEALLVQLAVSSVLSKKAGALFKKTIEGMTSG